MKSGYGLTAVAGIVPLKDLYSTPDCRATCRAEAQICDALN